MTKGSPVLTLAAIAAVGATATIAWAQSSALYMAEPTPQSVPVRAAARVTAISPVPAATPGANGSAAAAAAAPPGAAAPASAAAPATPVAADAGNSGARGSDRGKTTLAPAVASASLMAVTVPEPKKYSVHDLVTIVVRESTTADSESTMDTKKTVDVKDAVTEFPDLDPSSLAKLVLRGGKLSNGPSVAVNADHEFKGDGTYSRKDSLTTRLTAQIIDVKPNGTLVLEARKFIQSDKETLNIVLTGTCRKDDIATDNTVLSTQLYDLRLNKEHTGDIKNTAKKGIFTQVLDFLFNF